MTGRMLTVHRYDLPMASAPAEVTPLRLPAGAKILKIGEQNSDPACLGLVGPHLFIWALVDPAEQLQELRYVVTAGTGHNIEITKLSSRDWDYQETVLTLGGSLAVHVWISRPEGSDNKQIAADNA